MSGSGRLALFLALLVSIPVISILPAELSLIGNAEAAGCSVDADDATEWEVHKRNVTINASLGEQYFEDDGPNRRGKGRQSDPFITTEDEQPLEPLTSGFHTTFTVENGSGTGLQLNLTTGQRYTFCIDIDDIEAEGITEPPIDAYLFLTHDYDMYSEQYAYMNSEFGEFLHDLEQHIPPEWRGGLWRPFRDIHDYENIRSVEFSVVLDKVETSSSLFSGETYYEEFIILIDAIDNTRMNDAPAPHAKMQVDLTVMVEDAFILPTWTVPLTCFALLMILSAVPVLMHFKHANAGLDEVKVDLVPTLEKSSSTMAEEFNTPEETTHL